MFDYLIGAKSFRGSRCFGIITDLRQWRIVWLPSEDDIACSQPSSSTSAALALWPASERVLHSSRIFDLSEPGLIHALVSAVRKAQALPMCPVRLASRQFMAYSETTWGWRTLSRSTLTKSSLDFVFHPPGPQCEHLYLRSFGCGPKKRVILTFDDSTESLRVLKLFKRTKQQDSGGGAGAGGAGVGGALSSGMCAFFASCPSHSVFPLHQYMALTTPCFSHVFSCSRRGGGHMSTLCIVGHVLGL